MRLFLAIMLGERFSREIQSIALSLNHGKAKVRWEKTEKLHLTLHFLGDITAEKALGIIDILRETAQKIKPFRISASRYGVFPDKGPAKIIWVGLSPVPDELYRCFNELGLRLGELGLDPQRRAFVPHITLGRVAHDPTKGGLREAVYLKSCAAVSERVTEIHLVHSLILPSSSEYKVLFSEPLVGNKAQ